MTVIIKNNKERLINLGTKEGSMLIFNPGEEKEVSETVSLLFESDIAKYVEGKILSVVTKKKAAKIVDSIEEKAPVVKKKTTKKVTKKKVAKVAKE